MKMRFSMRQFLLLLLMIAALATMAQLVLLTIAALYPTNLTFHDYGYGNEYPSYTEDYPEAWTADIHTFAPRVEAFNVNTDVLFSNIEANLEKPKAMRSKVEAGRKPKAQAR
jgi:hypothetical protein